MRGKTGIFTAICLIAACLGKAPPPALREITPEQNELMGRLARELGPDEINMLLKGPADQSVKPLPVNELLYLLDRVGDMGKIVTFVRKLREADPPGEGSRRILQLIDAIKQLGCTRATFEGYTQPGRSWNSWHYQDCDTRDYNYMNIMAQIMSRLSEKGINNLVLTLRQQVLSSASADSNYRRFLLKLAYLVVGYDSIADVNDPEEKTLAGAKRLGDLIEAVIDGRDVVYLLNIFDTNNCPNAQGFCVDSATLEWSQILVGNPPPQMQELRSLLELMQQVTDDSKLPVLINGRRTAAGISEDAQQIVYLGSKLKAVLNGPIPSVPDWKSRLISLINDISSVGKLVYITDQVGDIQKLNRLVGDFPIAQLSKMSELINLCENGDSWQNQKSGVQKWQNFPANLPTGDSAIPRLVKLLNGVPAGSSPNTLSEKLIPLLTGISDRRKLARLIQEVENMDDLITLVNNLNLSQPADVLARDNLLFILESVNLNSIPRMASLLDGQRLPGNQGAAAQAAYLQKLEDFMANLDSTKEGPLKTTQLMDQVSNPDKLVDLIYDVTNIANLANLVNNIFKSTETVGCTDTAYTTQATCEANDWVWGPRDSAVTTVIYLIENTADSSKLVTLINAIDTTNMTRLLNGVAQGSRTADDGSSDLTAAGKKLAGLIDNITEAGDIVYLLMPNDSDGGNPHVQLHKLMKLINSMKVSSAPKVAELVNLIEGPDCWRATNALPYTTLYPISGGAGYTSAPTVNISLPPAHPAQAIALISGGEVKKVIFTRQGSGYTANPTLSLSGGGGSGASLPSVVRMSCQTSRGLNGGATGLGKVVNLINYVTPVSRLVTLIDNVDNGQKLGILLNFTEKSSNLIGLIQAVLANTDLGITDEARILQLAQLLTQLTQEDSYKLATIVNHLADATETPTSVNPSLDHEFIAKLMVNYNGTSGGLGLNNLASIVRNLQLTGGSGYSSASVGFSGGGGSGASAVAKIEAGKIVGISVTNSGSGYTTNPTVTITGSGSGAQAQAYVAGSLSSLSQFYGGSNYVEGDTCEVRGAGGSGGTCTVVASGGMLTGCNIHTGGSNYYAGQLVLIEGGCSGKGGTAIVSAVTGGSVRAVVLGRAALHMAQMINLFDKTSNNAVNYNDTEGKISTREALVRMIVAGVRHNSPGYLTSPVGYRDYPGFGPAHLARAVLSNLSGPNSLQSIMATLTNPSTNMTELVVLIGCGDQVSPNTPGMSSYHPPPPDFYPLCSAHNPSLWW
ncbi:MAG: hypothetical protein RML34_05650 [Leptospiraceae bacterium]|nr:hypothetical protein [Leptospiraceae bacterium]